MTLTKSCVLASVLLLCSACNTQDNVKPEGATAAVVRAYRTHDIVMFGEAHANRQEYEWLSHSFQLRPSRIRLRTSSSNSATRCTRNPLTAM